MVKELVHRNGDTVQFAINGETVKGLAAEWHKQDLYDSPTTGKKPAIEHGQAAVNNPNEQTKAQNANLVNEARQALNPSAEITQTEGRNSGLNVSTGRVNER